MHTPEEVKSFFTNHWTVRKYKDVKIPKDHLEAILFAGQRAPTDATAQMYTVIHLTDQAVKKEMALLTKNAHVETASESFIMCADIWRLKKILNLHDYELGKFPKAAIHFSIGDIVMVGQNMLTAAEMLGYRGCWIGGVMNALPEIQSLLKLPQGVFPFAAMTIGVPDEEAKFRPRLERSLVVHENVYQKYDDEALKKSAKDMGPITMRGDWPQTLNGYFGKGGAMEVRDAILRELLQTQIEDLD